MNLASSVAIYAVVNKELTGELEFPGSEKFYNMFDCFTDSKRYTLSSTSGLFWSRNVETNLSISTMEIGSLGRNCGQRLRRSMDAKSHRDNLRDPSKIRV